LLRQRDFPETRIAKGAEPLAVMKTASINSVSATMQLDRHIWWCRARPYSKTEVVGDALVHCVGIAVAVVVGGALILVGSKTEPTYTPALCIYVASLVTLLTVSLAFNMAPIAPLKRLLARLDQAAIFLLIAGTYTPILAALSETPKGTMMLTIVWGAALVGVALKLLVPERFGRSALILYAGLGWSGVAVFDRLSQTLPTDTLWLLLAGGLSYTVGIFFHVQEKLQFHNVVWHCFVVVGATLHLWAILGWIT
jgi:hemolysin III